MNFKQLSVVSTTGKINLFVIPSYWVDELKYAPSLDCTAIILLPTVSLEPRQYIYIYVYIYICRFSAKKTAKGKLQKLQGHLWTVSSINMLKKTLRFMSM